MKVRSVLSAIPVPDGTEALRMIEDITPHQLRVVVAVAAGMRGHEIAEKFGMSPTNVRAHFRNAMMRIGVERRADMIRIVLAAAIHARGMRT